MALFFSGTERKLEYTLKGLVDESSRKQLGQSIEWVNIFGGKVRWHTKTKQVDVIGTGEDQIRERLEPERHADATRHRKFLSISPDEALVADVNKIHAEINQYITLRFNILLAILTVFGVVLGGMMTTYAEEMKKCDATAAEHAIWNSTLLAATGNTLYSLLFAVAQMLLGDMWMLSAYLLSTGQSQWERRARSLLGPHRVNYYRTFGLTRQLLIVTIAVAVLTTTVPFAFHGVNPLRPDSFVIVTEQWPNAVSAAAVLLVVAASGLRKFLVKGETQWIEEWDNCLRNEGMRHSKRDSHAENYWFRALRWATILAALGLICYLLWHAINHPMNIAGSMQAN